MKKVVTIATAITVIILISCSMIMLAWADPILTPSNYLYPRTAVVREIDYEQGIIIIEDFEGLFWEFESKEEWSEHYIVSLLMSDNGTPEYIYDDEIIIACYGGWIDD